MVVIITTKSENGVKIMVQCQVIWRDFYKIIGRVWAALVGILLCTDFTSALAQNSVRQLDGLLQKSQVQDNQVDDRSQAPAQTLCPDGVIQIIEFGWYTAQLLAHMHKIILEQGFECTVKIVPADMSRVTRLLAQGRDLIMVPELWLSQIAPIWNELVNQELVQTATPTFQVQQLQGWYVPDFAFSDDQPRSIAAFKTAVQASGNSVDFISCPQGWACHLINQNMFKAFDLTGIFNLIVPEDLADMNAKITLSISQKKPVMFYYWEPSALMAQYNFIRLSADVFSPEGYVCNSTRACATPSQTEFGAESVVLAVSNNLMRDHKEIARYLSQASLDVTHINQILNAQLLTGKPIAELAVSLLKNQSEWQNWVESEVTARIQAHIAPR